MRILTTLLIAGTAWAAALQTTQTPTQTPRPQTTPATGAVQRDDGILANWLLIGNEGEVAIAQIGAQRATNEEVKAFARKMVEEHGQMKTKLQPFANAVGFTKPGEGPITGEDREAGAGLGEPNRPRDASFGTGEKLDHVQLLQELGQQCLASARKELDAKQGEDFDKCFMGMMIGGHMHMNDMLTVFQRHADPALAGLMRDAQGSVSQHLDEAKSLVKKLEGEAK